MLIQVKRVTFVEFLQRHKRLYSTMIDLKNNSMAQYTDDNDNLLGLAIYRKGEVPRYSVEESFIKEQDYAATS